MLAFNSSGTHPITSPVVTMTTADVLQRTSSKLSTFINRCMQVRIDACKNQWIHSLDEWMHANLNGYII